MTKHIATCLLVCSLLASTASATSYRPRTTEEKIQEAELIVYGKASLTKLPLENSDGPVKMECRIVILEQIWPSETKTKKEIVVNRWVWRQWPKTWWDYNSTTGIYFLKKTSTAVQEARKRQSLEAKYDATLREHMLEIPDDFYGNNEWIGLERMDDWYEPETKKKIVLELVKSKKPEKAK